MKCRVLQLQTYVYEEKEKNIAQCRRALIRRRKEEATKVEFDFVCLPEMFTTPYDTKNFPKYAEPEGGKTWKACSDMAKEFGVYICAGSIPEVDEEGNVYNTAYVFDRQGRQIAKHRKVYLFDVDIKGGQYFKESDTLTAGNQCTVFDTEFGKMGICICYDLRFPELSLEMARQGAQVIFVPASFNMTTGPLHWELLFRQRAVDNQCYFVGTATAWNKEFSYHSYGHSIVVDPWGKVCDQASFEPKAQICEIDFDYIKAIRQQLPLLEARKC